MPQTEDRTPKKKAAAVVDSGSADMASSEFNTVGVISLALTAIATGLCGLMFLLADQLPDQPARFANLTTTPEQLRLLIVGCSSAVLAFIACGMSVIGLLIPRKARATSIASLIISLIVLLGVYGVIAVALWMAGDQSQQETTEAGRFVKSQLA